MFVVPVTSLDQENIPQARKNHNKFMVTDEAAYIGIQLYIYKIKYIVIKLFIINKVLYYNRAGTSNWSGDYFVNSAGDSNIN